MDLADSFGGGDREPDDGVLVERRCWRRLVRLSGRWLLEAGSMG